VGLHDSSAGEETPPCVPIRQCVRNRREDRKEKRVPRGKNGSTLGSSPMVAYIGEGACHDPERREQGGRI